MNPAERRRIRISYIFPRYFPFLLNSHKKLQCTYISPVAGLKLLLLAGYLIVIVQLTIFEITCGRFTYEAMTKALV